MSATSEARDVAVLAATAAADKLGQDIAIFDVSERLPLADCFVIVTGNTERHVSALVDAVTETLAARGHKPRRREGERDGRWVLLDFGDIVVHIQHSEERVFYALDKLWGDCPHIPVPDSIT